MSFHEIRFPTAISRGSVSGTERRTQIVALGSGHEERNSSWADSRRFYNAGYGIKTLDDLQRVIEFYEERRGRLYGFRWKDRLDHKSCRPSQTPQPTDQVIGVGDGVRTVFPLSKTYGSVHAPWQRAIVKPVAGTVRIAVDGSERQTPDGFAVDTVRGLVIFPADAVPGDGALVTAGFEFDVPVRFDEDRLQIDLNEFDAGRIPDIPIREIRV